MNQDQILQLILAHVEAENQHDMLATLRTLHPQCEFVDHAMRRSFQGHAGAREHYELWWNAFDLHVAGERRCIDGSTFCAETRFRGVHRGEFLGIPPSGRRFDLQVAVFVDVRDGLMAGERFYYDMRELLAQIGGDGR